MLSIKEKLSLFPQGYDSFRPNWECDLNRNKRTSPEGVKKFRSSAFVPIPRRFNEVEVGLIRSLYQPSKVSYQDLADRFKTCKATIDHVINGKGAYREL